MLFLLGSKAVPLTVTIVPGFITSLYLGRPSLAVVPNLSGINSLLKGKTLVNPHRIVSALLFPVD